MKEPQYNQLLTTAAGGVEWLGLMTNDTWKNDPKRLCIVMARYKFVAKMLAGAKKVAEVGCGDGFVSRIVKDSVGHLHIYDFDKAFIDDFFNRQKSDSPRIHARVHDIVEWGPLEEAPFDAVYSLDVMEHIKPEKEGRYLNNIAQSMSAHGTFIVGMPSLESQAYASRQSKEGHVNCKTGEDLKKTLKKHFHNVFLFSMNDEVIHTGYYPMAHYLMAICTEPKNVG